MSNLVNGHGTGWQRDLPDHRDYTPHNVSSKGGLQANPLHLADGPARVVPGTDLVTMAPILPTSVDLRQWCSPIEDQGQLGSCTAFAGAGLVEYAMRRAYGRHVDVSPLFLYKVTRNLMGVTGDTGAWLREMLKALAMCGVGPEELLPYDVSRFDMEPPAFLYALAQNYQAIRYLRLDPPGNTPQAILQRIKTMLVAGFPAAFGFSVYDSIAQAGATGMIPFPQAGERVVGGHALDAVGYDDGLTIRGHQGALLIRNSWGAAWGGDGYGYLPYEYILQGQAVDFWSILKQEWLDTGRFG